MQQDADRLEPIGEVERFRRRSALVIVTVLACGLLAVFVGTRYRGAGELVNVSYDATREYFAGIAAGYSRAAPDADVHTTHAGSVRQAQGVVRGFKADVVTLANAGDIDAIAGQTGLIDSQWRSRFPHDSSPFTSTIVFLVRAGNPKNIRDWNDLVRPDVQPLAPSPNVSGGGRYAYLAAWGYALEAGAGDETHAERFVASLYSKNSVLEEGARSVLLTFLQQNDTDVLLTWESEARHAAETIAVDRVQVIYPARSIRAEPAVAVVDRYAEERGTAGRAAAYLRYLFSEEGQEIAARHFLRPRNPAVAARHAARFPEMEVFDVAEVFGSWSDAVRKHFEAGGTFDRIHNFERLKRAGS